MQNAICHHGLNISHIKKRKNSKNLELLLVALLAQEKGSRRSVK